MYLFHNDYNVTCHDSILQNLKNTQYIQHDGYGLDAYCKGATEKIRLLCNNQNLSVHYLTGGTQANLTIIASILRPYQAVLTVESGHINVHETGSVEATGHKVVTVPSTDGKINAQQVRSALEAQLQDECAEHNVQIKLVYISNSTEFGTIYTLAELEALSQVCRQYGIYLFMDGARLSYALTAADCDVTISDLARLCDVFYIGGTKCGGMFGEAVVFANRALAEDFRYMIKQRGAMLAKGWLLGLQFDTLLENGLYFDIARAANQKADKIRDTIRSLGYELYLPNRTNQIFAILPNKLLKAISQEFTFMVQQRLDNQSIVRFCTSWATTDESVEALCNALSAEVSR